MLSLSYSVEFVNNTSGRDGILAGMATIKAARQWAVLFPSLCPTYGNHGNTQQHRMATGDPTLNLQAYMFLKEPARSIWSTRFFHSLN